MFSTTRKVELGLPRLLAADSKRNPYCPSVIGVLLHYVAGNDWSGPPEGLTLQRAIRALESYGHHTESVLIGLALTDALLSAPGCSGNASLCHFPQQIDPFTALPYPGTGYGPMMISLLEYTARRVGIVPLPTNQAKAPGAAGGGDGGDILWSSFYRRAVGLARPAADDSSDGGSSSSRSVYTQRLAERVFSLWSGLRRDGTVWAAATVSRAVSGGGSTHERFLFNCTTRPLSSSSSSGGGVRIITSLSGRVTQLVGIAGTVQLVHLVVPAAAAAARGGGWVGGAPPTISISQEVGPNEVWVIERNGSVAAASVPFYRPHS